MVIFCQKYNADDLQVEEAVVVLRQSLAKAESKSVTIVTVGFLINIRLCNSNLITNTTRVGISDRQHCRLTICIELVELANSETAAATPSGGGARSLRSHSSLETGSF